MKVLIFSLVYSKCLVSGSSKYIKLLLFDYLIYRNDSFIRFNLILIFFFIYFGVRILWI